MIVRDLGDAWQVVMQTDHADLSGAFARAWAEPVSPALVVAAERHDDGWAVWEQSPRVDDDGKPVNFLEVDVRAHLAFYRAGIAAITEEDRGRRPAGLDARRGDLPAALRPRPGARPRPRRGGSGRGGGVRRGAGVEVRRRPEEPLGGLRAPPALRPPLALLLHARRRGGRAPGLPDRAGRPVARAPVAVPVRRRRGRVLAAAARDPEERPRGRARHRARARPRSASSPSPCPDPRRASAPA